MRGALRGLDDLRRGGALVVRTPRLWRWVAAPFAVTLAAFVGLVALLVAGLGPLTAWLAAALPGWLAGWLPGLVAVAVVALALFGAWFAFVAVALAVAAPFNEGLSEAVEAIATGRPPPRTTLGGLLHDLGLGVAHGVRRTTLYLALTGLLLAVAARVPGVGAVLAAALGFWVTARFAAWDAYDAVLARRRMSYADKRRFVAAHRGRSGGLGVGVAALLLVPGPNLVALSLGAAGATLGYLDLTERVIAPRGAADAG